MIILNGKYNIAKVMLPKDEQWEHDGRKHYKYLDIATQEQIESFLNHPAFAGPPIIIMPDTHYGKGSCVGFTMKLNNYIVPNVIGVDIGCGIMATNLGKIYIDDGVLKGFDDFVRKNVPAGFSLHDEPKEWFTDELDLENACEFMGVNYVKVIRSVGTLGGGNHFIELGKDEEGNIWLTIHSGSRNFGLQVATKYQKLANERCATYFQNFGDLNFLPLESENEAQDYLDYMGVAQHFANINRRTMTRIIMEGYFHNVNFQDQIDSVHNYIDFEDGIIRKGSTPARLGQKLVIPFNMQDGLIIGEGLGNKDWNYSAPHGAGRILSRKKAKAQLDLGQAVIDMKEAGVFTTSLNQNTLDEVKGAYKDKELIVSMIQETVKIINWVKPIYNFKAG